MSIRGLFVSIGCAAFIMALFPDATIVQKIVAMIGLYTAFIASSAWVKVP